jgi:predicted ATPase
MDNEMVGNMTGEPGAGWETFFDWLERAHTATITTTATSQINTSMTASSTIANLSNDMKASSNKSMIRPLERVRVYVAAWWSDASTTFRPLKYANIVSYICFSHNHSIHHIISIWSMGNA